MPLRVRFRQFRHLWVLIGLIAVIVFLYHGFLLPLLLVLLARVFCPPFTWPMLSTLSMSSTVSPGRIKLLVTCSVLGLPLLGGARGGGCPLQRDCFLALLLRRVPTE